MKVSVIIPVYNAERTLKRCLDSVLVAAREVEKAGGGGQRTVEVICVNDGSADGSLKVLEGYREKLTGAREDTSRTGVPFTILTQPNAGQGAARNAALAVATGDAVVFVDSDDFILPRALECLVRAAEESGAPVVSSMSFARDVAPAGQSNAGWRLKPASWMAGKKVQYSVCGKLFRRDILKGLVFPSCVYEDFAFATEVLGSIEQFAVIDSPLYVYCSNDAATTTRSGLTPAKIEASFTVLKHVVDFFRPRGFSRFVRRQLADGLSSTVGQVYKARDRALAEAFLCNLVRFGVATADVGVRLSPKARYRLWRLRRRTKGGAA